ncbi:hypothetical protein AVEN_55344-1 [Araneus ventricosus]|uniref:Uncharacterized protein n=1 Tax=Araneus ventricosus TaxID=182803 RepID=A0A4Y2DC26_ARAVE|nr:hypothetical protein AVEN_55344-1 [Araneus ventricosus]
MGQIDAKPSIENQTFFVCHGLKIWKARLPAMVSIHQPQCVLNVPAFINNLPYMGLIYSKPSIEDQTFFVCYGLKIWKDRMPAVVSTPSSDRGSK